MNRNLYLYHHGIIGQKWGNRRYQNEDGTLTTEGKMRYAKKYMNAASYDATKLYYKAKKHSEKADEYENNFRTTRSLYSLRKADKERIKQAKNEDAFKKNYSYLDNQSRDEVYNFVGEIGNTSLSSLSPNTIKAGRRISASMVAGGLTFGVLGVGTTAAAGSAYLKTSKRITEDESNVNITAYDKKGRLTRM